MIFAGRVQFLTDTPLHIDEARSGMRMMGTPAEIIAWQPPDWPPLHNILLGIWSELVGEYPFSLRVFSAYFSILGICFAYCMAYQITQHRMIAFGTMIVYGGLGMGIYLGVFIRGYAIVMALFPLAILLTDRYFKRHRWHDALGLAVTMGLMFLSTYTSAIAFLSLGFLTLLLHFRQLWRWVIIGLLASPFAVVELLRKWDFWIGRFTSEGTVKEYIYDPLEVFIQHYQHYFGQAPIFWMLLITIAIILWLWKGRQQTRLYLWVLVGCVIAPLITYEFVASDIYVIMTTRYSWWVLILLAFGISLSLRYVPRLLSIGGLTIILLMMFILPLEQVYYHPDPAAYYYEDNLEWLRQQIQFGDVLMFDPNFCRDACQGRDELAYYWDVYLDDALILVDNPTDYRRVWVWRGIGHDRNLLEQLSKTHIPTLFNGPPESLLELYEAPPDPIGISFDNGMRFLGYDIIDDQQHRDLPPYDLREQMTMKVRLWWAADHPIVDDYQVSLQIHNALTRQMFAQDDGAPKLLHLKPNAFEQLPTRTSQWTPDTLYVEERVIEFPDISSEVDVDIFLSIYRLSDGCLSLSSKTNPDGLLPLFQSIVWGWG